MLKVVLILKEITLRLKESELYVIIRKNKETFPLASKCKITNGFCFLDSTAQFYLSPTSSSLNIEAIFLQGNVKKLAGNTILNISQWQPNVLHQTVSALNNSPDKKARISFSFYYFIDRQVNDRRSIFLSSARFYDQAQTLYEKNHELMRQTNELKSKLGDEESRNKKLLQLKTLRQLDISQAEKFLKDEMEPLKKSINNSHQSYNQLKNLRMKLSKLVNQKGLGGLGNQ